MFLYEWDYKIRHKNPKKLKLFLKLGTLFKVNKFIWKKIKESYLSTPTLYSLVNSQLQIYITKENKVAVHHKPIYRSHSISWNDKQVDIF